MERPMITPPPDDPVDLRGVAPSRRAETRRRIEAVREWLSRDRISPGDLERFAARLSVAPSTFLIIVQAWKEHGTASAVPGATGRGTPRPRRLRPSIPAGVEAIITRAIDEAGVDARPVDVTRIVEATCREAGAAPPEAGLVARRLYRARAAAARISGVSALTIDHCALRLPVVIDGATRAPVLTLAFDEGGRVFAHRLRLEPPSPRATAAVLADALRLRAADGPIVPVHVAADRTPAWKALLQAMESNDVTRIGRMGAPVPSGRTFRRVFGDAVRGVGLAPNLTHHALEARPAGWLRTPAIPFDEAAAAMADVLGPSVSARPRLASDGAEHRLADELERLSLLPDEAPRARRVGD